VGRYVTKEGYMNIGSSGHEQNEINSTRKIILSGVIVLCVLLAIGLGVIINLFLIEPSVKLPFNIFGSVFLPICVSGYVLHYYYKHYFIGVK